MVGVLPEDGNFSLMSPTIQEKVWKKISGASKDLIARTLVDSGRRITADQILKHPWIRQLAPPTPLVTPGILRRSSERTIADSLLRQVSAPSEVYLMTSKLSSINMFCVEANERNREVDIYETPGIDFELSSVVSSSVVARREMLKRRRSVLATSFRAVEALDLELISTPRFNRTVSPDV